MRGAPEKNKRRGLGIRNGNCGKRKRDAGAQSERLQFLAGLEAHGFSGRDADFLAGAGISTDAGLSRAHVEYAEAAQLDSFAFSERTFHGFKNGFHRLLGLGPAHSGLVYDRIYDIQLDHYILPLFNGSLC
jgi:hypothetical protein